MIPVRVQLLDQFRSPALIEIAGVVAVTVGVGFIWWPAALIVGGIAAVLIAQGMDR